MYVPSNNKTTEHPTRAHPPIAVKLACPRYGKYDFNL